MIGKFTDMPVKFVVFTDFLINFSKLQISSSQLENPSGLTTNTTTQRGLEVRVRVSRLECPKSHLRVVLPRNNEAGKK
jgi:hypothetical protein